jgi:hypothetical protein
MLSLAGVENEVMSAKENVRSMSGEMFPTDAPSHLLMCTSHDVW